MSEDLISRQAAIEAIYKVLCVKGKEYLYPDEERIVKSIGKLPSAQQWVPVSERLPHKYGVYLVTVKGLEFNTTDFCKYFPATKEFAWGEPCNDVIAWMPLPEPYKEEDNE